MANIKSAKKKINTIERRHQENKYIKATIATLIKKFRKLIEEGKIEEAEKYSKEVYSYIDSACSKGIIHKNNASRKIGRLAQCLYKAKVSTTNTTIETNSSTSETKKENTDIIVEEPKTKKTSAKKASTDSASEKKSTSKKSTKKDTEEKPTKKASSKKATTKSE